MPRMPSTSLLLAALGLLVLSTGCAAPPADPAGSGPLRIMSFNIRYGTADDGEDRWELRRDFVMEVIEDFGPHVLGVQEGVDFQMAELRRRFPRMRQLGQHRMGGTSSEFSGLLVDESRLAVEDWGEFWLSPTPEVVASKGWDAALPRMAVWAVLSDRTAPAGTRFLAVGTHFDHRGELARLESARLIVQQVAAIDNEWRAPVVILGDFNAGEGSAPMEAIRRSGYIDSFRVAHPDATEVGTFSAFRGETTGPMIDHLWCSPGWRVESADILRPRRPDGRCPSDHEPVVAVLSLLR
ncbi:MAG: endonuclease/exonuclease/phosphatase family protein [Planctomycetes bacterium]|nr:endonuclease/exonuclease/phosphatase family protein [Planctomycetota bacterium]